ANAQGVNWESPTLGDDLKKAFLVSAAKAKADLFGDTEVPGTDRASVTQKPVEEREVSPQEVGQEQPATPVVEGNTGDVEPWRVMLKDQLEVLQDVNLAKQAQAIADNPRATREQGDAMLRRVLDTIDREAEGQESLL